MAEICMSSATIPRDTISGLTHERPPLAGGLVRSDKKLPKYHRKLTISYQVGIKLSRTVGSGGITRIKCRTEFFQLSKHFKLNSFQ